MNNNTMTFIDGLFIGAITTALTLSLIFYTKYTRDMHILEQQCAVKGGQLLDKRCVKVENIK